MIIPSTQKFSPMMMKQYARRYKYQRNACNRELVLYTVYISLYTVYNSWKPFLRVSACMGRWSVIYSP